MSTALPRVRLERGRQAAPQVFDVLRERILTLSLAPGTVLSRTALMDEFGLSQTPIRDALMRLAEEGLVEVFPQHATVVSAIDLTLARQAHFLRCSIELEVVRVLALKRERDFVAGLTLNLARQQAAQAVDDVDGFAALDHAFHRDLYETAGVPELWTLVRSRSGHIDRLRRLHLPVPGKTAAIVVDHRAVVDAIAAGDPDGAQRAMRRHLSGTLSQIEAIRERHPDYVRD